MSAVTAPRDGPAALPGGLHDAFGALDRAGARWALLRSGSGLTTVGEVDVLVHPDDLATVEAALERSGWLHLPSWGRGSHRFHVRHEPVDDRFLTLDLVSEVAFGRYAEHRTATVEALLRRRQQRAGVSVLHPADAYWALLLHARHDVRTVEERHVHALRRLEHLSVEASPLAEVAQRLADPRPRLRYRLPAATRRTWRRVVRRLNRRRAGRVKGLTVAVLGADGAGKSTLVAERPPTWPFPVVDHYLGLYDTRARARRPAVPGLRFLGRLHSFRRALRAARRDRRRGRLVLLDRYPYDVLVLDGTGAPGKRALQRLVVRAVCPPPDVAIVLDAPGGLLHARSGEHDPEELERQRQRYLDLQRHLPHRHRPRIEIVDATTDPATIRRDVSRRLWGAVVDRRRAAR